jgi:uncharacterized 2Fe-2S/4Fe-4S cluster protein (DUF4445 family)
MSKVRIDLQPLGRQLEVEPGTRLQDILFGYGVEFPCGGRGKCRSCRVRVIGGALEPTGEESAILTAAEIADGWRLACRARVDQEVTLEIRQWEAAILADSSRFDFVPRDGLGVAVDLGTTTVVGQLLDLRTGNVLAVQAGLNPQVVHGADIMSRVDYAVAPEGRDRLQGLIRTGIGELLRALLQSAGKTRESVRTVVIVGNTAMHHLFCGTDISPLASYPFEPAELAGRNFAASSLGWNVPGDPSVGFLPCLGGFVGSDILAGILATRMHESQDPVGLVDLGTNGEVVIGNRDRMVCASTAAGPAFEGARIRMGMQAATGAISEVRVVDSAPECHVLGGVTARGICGSGLVDAVAAGLELGIIGGNGKFCAGRDDWEFCPPVSLTQGDVRELQLAKGAIAAAIKLLIKAWGAQPGDLKCIYLAGAFGNYVNRTSARRIGLIEFPEETVSPAGNTALLGAKLALFDCGADYSELLGRIRHIPLAADPDFQDVFVDSMLFPDEA